MKIKQLKEYLNQLPVELDDYSIVYSEIKDLQESELVARLDQPIESIVVDNINKEMIIGTSDTIDKVVEAFDNIDVPVGLQTPQDIEPLADGTYPCIWSGWNVWVRVGGKTFSFSTKPVNKGIKGMNVPATVVIKDGVVTDVRDSKTMKDV